MLSDTLFRIFLAASAVGMCACSSGAQIEAQRQDNVLAELIPALQDCYGKIDADPRYAPIHRKVSFDGSLQALTDATRPTKTEVELLYAMHSDTQGCRKLQLDAASRAHPLRVVVFVELFSEADKAWADVVTGKSTWGEFNQRRKNATDSAKTRMVVAEAQIASDLQRQHVDEIAQRQRAAAAFQQWAHQQQQMQQQQQAINAINRPRTINCNYYGSSAQCTSF